MAASRAPQVATVDFETKPIRPAPDYPPEPVGVSIRLPGERRARYLAFGHPGGNNCSREDARRALRAVWESRVPVLFHHSKFDMAVASRHWGLRPLPWERVHDTVFLLFLDDPYTRHLELKQAALHHLGVEPEERDAIREWAIGQRLMPKTRKDAGEFIHLAPPSIVGPYANGDVDRALRLFRKLHPSVVAQRGMGGAYDRERRLTPHLMANEEDGVPVDLDLLRSDAKKFGAASDAEKFGEPSMFSGGAMDQCDAWLRRALRSPGLNVDSDQDLADALVRGKKARDEDFMTTPTGLRSTAKDSIIGAVKDQRVLTVLQYRARLATAKNTFLLPWLREAELSGGRVRPAWNQVRLWGSGQGGEGGAKTGRLSASRFMNVPKPFAERAGRYAHPGHAGLPVLPEVRRYLVAERGHAWFKRDYAQQELRVLGHFEDGALREAYERDPGLDVHELAAGMLTSMGTRVTRDDTKTIGFALLYGMGLGSLAERLGVDVAQARRLKAAYLGIFPGLEALDDDLKERGRAGLPVRTWGGREYLVEPPAWSAKYGRQQTFEYKLLNFLIQGSSADCTKEAIIRYCESAREGIFKITVHDEINGSAPAGAVRRELLVLREAMASVEFDVKMLSDGSAGPRWSELERVDEAEEVAA